MGIQVTVEVSTFVFPVVRKHLVHENFLVLVLYNRRLAPDIPSLM
jgi:Na+-transporting NADH:ubiquinone oxidoreductase subunit NqrB